MAEIGCVGVCGAGAMGGGIAQVAASAGHQVIVFDTSPRALEAGEMRLATNLASTANRGRLSAEEADAIAGRVRWVDDLAALKPCALIIEAILEDVSIKRALFGNLERVLSADTILATNTSSLSVAGLANGLAKPERFVGMHFFNPPTAMKLVEVVRGPSTSADVEQRVFDLANKWGKKPVLVADVPGFIVNRVARPFYAEAFRALQERAAPPEAIDHLFRASAAFRMGPLELTDLIGHDVNYAVARSVFEAYHGATRFIPQLGQRQLVEAGWLGRKSGRGVYDYSAGSPPSWEAPAPHGPISPGAFDALLAGEVSEHDGVLIRVTRGRRAATESAAASMPVALLDWFDDAAATSIGFCVSDARISSIVRDYISARGRSPVEVADRPGMIVMRTLAQIANAAGDAIFENVSDEAGIDRALHFGANYPIGPCEWASSIGIRSLTTILEAMQAETGQAIYAPSEYWRTAA